MIIKILSYNIHKGFDWRNRKYFLSDMRQLISMSSADIVFLQEVVGENLKFKKLGLIDNQFDFLVDGTLPHYSYGKNVIHSYGHHGNIILSKYPIESFENINITTNNFEKRGMLVCKLLTELGEIYAICLHLNIFHSGRNIQYKKIEHYLHHKKIDSKSPVIIAGDFNDWNMKAAIYLEDKLEMVEVFKACHGFYAVTFPSLLPLLSLDRIYIKNLKVLKAETISYNNSHLFSDHLPIYCEVILEEK